MKKSDLLNGLEIVKPGLSRSDVIDQATFFAFVNGRVVTYNDEISVSHPVEGLEIEGAVKADILYNLLKKIKNEDIELEVSGEELSVKSGKTKAGIAFDGKVLLPLEEISEKTKFKKLPSNFSESVLMAAGACSNSTAEPILMCVNIAGKLVQASDGYRIMQVELNDEMPIKTFLFPAASAVTALRLKPTKVSEGNGWVHFKNEIGTEISCRTFEESFPEIGSRLKMKGTPVTFPDLLLDVLERADVFAKRDSVLNESVTISITPKSVTVKADAEFGWFEESVKHKHDGENVEFMICPYLLKGILKQTKEAKLSPDKLKFTGENWVYVTALKD